MRAYLCQSLGKVRDVRRRSCDLLGQSSLIHGSCRLRNNRARTASPRLRLSNESLKYYVSFVKRFAGRRWLTDSSHGLGQFSLRMGQTISAPWQSACVPRWWRAYGESDCACTSVNTRIMNASNSSSEWNRATWPDTRCSTRPSYQGDAPVGWGRNCTTKTRLVGSDG